MPSTEVVDSEMLKAETHSHRTASPKASFLVDRGHRAWPGGVPASREVKWGLRRVRHIVLATGEGTFASLRWLQVAGISKVILFPQLRLLLLNCQVCLFLGPGVEAEGREPVPLSNLP